MAKQGTIIWCELLVGVLHRNGRSIATKFKSGLLIVLHYQENLTMGLHVHMPQKWLKRCVSSSTSQRALGQYKFIIIPDLQ